MTLASSQGSSPSIDFPGEIMMLAELQTPLSPPNNYQRAFTPPRTSIQRWNVVPQTLTQLRPRSRQDLQKEQLEKLWPTNRTPDSKWPRSATVVPSVPNEKKADNEGVLLVQKECQSDKRILQDLPVEIQERIVDMLVGNLSSTSSSLAGEGTQGMRNWSNAMRHPRRRQMSDLALVSRTWQRMIQERLYRHIKIKGTRDGLEMCADWFLSHPHLPLYVRHAEVWVPIYEKRSDSRAALQPFIPSLLTLVEGGAVNASNDLKLAYQLASQNSTLEEIFALAKFVFPDACILSLEGGHCKKPPMIQHFRNPSLTATKSAPQGLPSLPNIRTLVLKGSWNLMREESHFLTITSALPNLREWQCSYAKPKVGAYTTICSSLRHFPPTLVHLNLCLEGFYYKEPTSPFKCFKWRQLYPENHICHDLARITPQLESLTYTGRTCSSFFTTAVHSASQMRGIPRLKSLDFVVKNCCRHASTDSWNESAGIHNWGFIKAFEAVVAAGVKSLQTFTRLNFLRVRYIDLDSPCPLLNPYFQMQGSTCTGLWNEDIITSLDLGRPGARFEELSEQTDWGRRRSTSPTSGEMAFWPRGRPKSMRAESYLVLSDSASLL